jgi:hypothetical protein
MKKPAKKPSKKALPKNANGVAMLSGGNPQIPKGDGDAPVKLYIANMPGWKSALGKQLDALILKNVPKSAKLNKAVRWNSPFYGVEGKGWFVSFHVFAKYVKVTFFAGTSLEPLPPGGTPKSGAVRWIDLHENDASDAATLAQVGKWIRQASKIEGWIVS